MTVSTPVFVSIWVAGFLAWVSLATQYRSKWRSQLERLASDIRSYNARNGLDQSVRRKTLARDMRNPFRNEQVREFAANNNIVPEEYINELEGALNHPQRLFWAISLHFVILILILSGFTHFMPWGVVPTMVYLPVLYVLLAVSATLYFYL